MDGRYAIRALLAGDYLVAAVPLAKARDWQNPSFLELVGRTATRIALKDGEQVTRDLKMR
jgi:hypothetical protein